MKQIELSKGFFAIVDDDDFELLNSFKWHIDGKGYASRSFISDKKICIKMHRFLLGLTYLDNVDVDHINGCSVDNRRANLRICTHSNNMKNMKMHKDNKTGFKGVSLCKATGLFKAQICTNGKNSNLGRFKTPEIAHDAYKKASIDRHKEFSNF